MQVTRKDLANNKVELTITAETKELQEYKQHVLQKLAKEVDVQGFREGKAPLSVVEKNVDPQRLQGEVIEDAINHLYSNAIRRESLRPLVNPDVSMKKFVPYSTLEFTAVVDVLGTVKLADYKKIKKSLPDVKVSDHDVDRVIKTLQERLASGKEVKRPAENGDKVTIDFSGVDDKGKPIKGADGKDYPLLLGSDTFIPGFEKNLVKLKAGQKKTFTLTFPKDYAVKALAGSRVTFTVNVKKIEEQSLPEVNDKFAAQAGPFKSVDELKNNIKQELVRERHTQATQDLEAEIIKDVTNKSTLEVPELLVEDQIERLLAELRQNLTYRGLTYQEFLEREGKTEQAYRQELLVPEAKERVKAGLVLAEIADKEKVNVSPEELEARMQLLKGQYQDAAMQAELDKPESRQNIANRLLTEKTIQKLVEYATSH